MFDLSRKRPLTHVYTWGNPKKPLNEKRMTLKGRECCILIHGKKGSVMVEFENGQREVISFRALRKIGKQYQLNLWSETGKPLGLGGMQAALKNEIVLGA